MKSLTGRLRGVKAWPLALILCGPLADAQNQSADLPPAPTPNIVKFPGGVLVEQGTPGAMPLSLDDAIARGEKRNLQMLLAVQN